MVLRIAHQVIRSADLRALQGIIGRSASLPKRVMDLLYATDRGNRGELTTRNTVSGHTGRGGTRKAFLEMSGTAPGWKRGRGP
jgi:hypothetical protein